jgi:hypothetical protein
LLAAGAEPEAGAVKRAHQAFNGSILAKDTGPQLLLNDIERIFISAHGTLHRSWNGSFGFCGHYFPSECFFLSEACGAG